MKSNKQKLVIVGGGMAAVKLLEEFTANNGSNFAITLISKEPYLPYNRIQLSQLLSGDVQVENIHLKDQHWYFSHKVDLIQGVSVTAIDRQRKRVALSNSQHLVYDKLILCTGSNPAMIPLPGVELEGVCAFRTLQDVDYFIKTAAQKKHAVVIGGGLLGIEAACGLQQQGMQVSLIHIGEHLMENQLDAESANMLRDSLQTRGIQVYLQMQTARLLGDQRVTGVQFANQRTIAADLVVMAVGVRPNIEIAKSAQLDCDRGIVVNDNLVTSDPDVYALGECAQHRDCLFGLVAPIYQQAEVLAKQLTANGTDGYQGSMNFTKLKVSGIDVFSAGDIAAHEDKEELVYFDASQQVYKKLLLRENRLIGVIIYGLLCDTSWYVELMQQQSDVRAFRDDLLFGKSFVDEQLLIAGSTSDGFGDYVKQDGEDYGYRAALV